MSDNGNGKSLQWLVIASLIFVTVVGWGFLANSYVAATGETEFVVAPGGRTFRGRGQATILAALVNFVVNAITQLPNGLAVVTWHLKNRIWMIGLFLGLQAAVIAGAWGLRRLEQNLSRPPSRAQRNRRK